MSWTLESKCWMSVFIFVYLQICHDLLTRQKKHLFEINFRRFSLWNIGTSNWRRYFRMAIQGNSTVWSKRYLGKPINQCLSDSILNDNLVIFNVTPEGSMEALFLPQYWHRWINRVNWNSGTAKAIGRKPAKRYTIKSPCSSPACWYSGDVSERASLCAGH